MLSTFSREAPPEAIFAALEKDGGVIVEGLIDSECADRLERDFAPHLEVAEWCNTADGKRDEFFGFKTKRLHGLLGKSALFGELITHPLLLSMCDHFLKPHCRDYRISTGELMMLGRGETGQTLHRDADSWHYFPKPRPEILVSANIALTGFTEENGATVVVPGSHLWPLEREADPSEGVQATMKRGSALLYTGNVLHGGGANRTDETRTGLYFGYLLSWLRPIENHLITNPEEALRAAPARARRLLDYTETGWEVIA